MLCKIQAAQKRKFDLLDESINKTIEAKQLHEEEANEIMKTVADQEKALLSL